MLRAIAVRVGRLSPSHRDPEAYFVEKDELCHALRKLAKSLEGQR
jgi:hypothetical protein